MLEAVSNHIPEVTALACVVFGAFLSRWLRMKAKLQFSIGHSSTLLVEEPLLDKDGNKLRDVQVVQTASIALTNAGLLPATAAEVTFNWKPIFNVLPARAFKTEVSALNRFSIQFDSLAPGEQVTINIMSINQDLPVMTSVRAENCVGQSIMMASQRLWPKLVTIPLGMLALIGAVVSIYAAAASVQFLMETPRVGAQNSGDTIQIRPPTPATTPH